MEFGGLTHGTQSKGQGPAGTLRSLKTNASRILPRLRATSSSFWRVCWDLKAKRSSGGPRRKPSMRLCCWVQRRWVLTKIPATKEIRLLLKSDLQSFTTKEGMRWLWTRIQKFGKACQAARCQIQSATGNRTRSGSVARMNCFSERRTGTRWVTTSSGSESNLSKRLPIRESLNSQSR